MIAIQHMTRFLAGLGEIVNILTAPIVAALAYLASMERFMGERFMGERYMGQHMMGDDVIEGQMMGDQMMQDQMLGDQMMQDQMLGDQMMGDQMMMADPAFTTYAVNQDMAIFTSIIIAVVAVGFINGGFAVLFSIRRLLAEGQGPSSIKTAKTKTAEKRDAATPDAVKEEAQDMPKNTVKTATTPSKPKAKVKAKKATKTAKKKT